MHVAITCIQLHPQTEYYGHAHSHIRTAQVETCQLDCVCAVQIRRWDMFVAWLFARFPYLPDVVVEHVARVCLYRTSLWASCRSVYIMHHYTMHHQCLGRSRKYIPTQSIVMRKNVSQWHHAGPSESGSPVTRAMHIVDKGQAYYYHLYTSHLQPHSYVYIYIKPISFCL